jgi:hypothetical protein
MDEKKEEVKKYLKERAKELHKPVKRNFPRRPFSDGIPPGVPLHTSSEAGLPVLKCFRAPVADPQSAN